MTSTGDILNDTASPAPDAVRRERPVKRRGLAGRIVRFLGRTLRWSWPFLVLLLLFAVYNGYQRRSTGGEVGFGLQGGPSVAPTGAFRVAVFNIQGSVDKNPAVLERIAKALQPSDVAGLMEVRANARRQDSRSQAQQIAEFLPRGWIFAPAEQRFWAPGGGNALISRFDVGRWTRIPLPEEGDDGSCRNVLLADLPVAGRTVRLMVAHVDRGQSKSRQLQAVTHLFESTQGPVVLLADLNVTPGDPKLKGLRDAGGDDVLAQFDASRGDERVDYIFIKGLKATGAGRTDDRSLSDHALFWADLELAD